MKKACALSILIVILGLPGVTYAYTQILISEIMYDVAGTDTGHEWIEVFNSGTTSIDFSSWRLTEGEANHKIKEAKGDKILSPGAYAVIADNPEKFLADHTVYAGILYESSFSLSNEGETLALKDGTLNALHQVSYAKDVGAAGDGNSLQRIDGRWHVAVPTPGEANTLDALAQEHVEVLALPGEGSIVITGDLLIGETIVFDLDVDGKKKEIQWNFGDGSTEKKEAGAVDHVYAFAGTYTVIAEYDEKAVQTMIVIAEKPTLTETIEMVNEDQPKEVQSTVIPEDPVPTKEYESIEREVPSDDLSASVASSDPPIYPWLLALGGLAILAAIAVRIIRREEPSPVIVADDGIELID